MALLKSLIKVNKDPTISLLSASRYFEHETIPSDIPLLNVALNGTLDGGLGCGITMICGESKSFKSSFLVQMVKSHQRKYGEHSTCFYFDSEFSPISYYEKEGVNIDQMIHIPITTVEELKIKFSYFMDKIKENLRDNPNTKDRVIMLIDSIGGLASAKETQDALDGKSTADLTRSKALASFFRIATGELNMNDIPMVLINSHYQTLEMFSKNVVSGGKKIYLSSDNVWFISRAQDKDGKDLKGYKFTITADKSRTIKEGSKFPISVTWEDGIDKNSGLFDLATEAGIVIQSGAWYQTTDSDGVVSDKKQRRVAIETDEFFESLLKNETFKKFVENKYLL